MSAGRGLCLKVYVKSMCHCVISISKHFSRCRHAQFTNNTVYTI